MVQRFSSLVLRECKWTLEQLWGPAAWEIGVSGVGVAQVRWRCRASRQPVERVGGKLHRGHFPQHSRRRSHEIRKGQGSARSVASAF